MALSILDDIKITPRAWVKAGIYALLICMTYSSAFGSLLHMWKNDDFSYASLVPFFVVFLVWEKRKRLAAMPSDPSWSGIFVFGAGIGLYWLGELGGEYYTLYLSFWFVIVGLVWLHLGWRKVRIIWFALVMIPAMFPPPNVISVQIGLGLKLLSSQLGVWIIHLCGLSAFREGNIIDLGFTQLQVVDACSGLRYLLPLMILSLLFAHWFMGHFWKRVVLFGSSVPLAVFINSLRIAMTGILYHIASAEVARGFFHGFAGGLIFVVALPAMFGIVLILKRLPPRETGFSLQTADVPPGGYDHIQVKSRPQPGNGWTQALFQPRFIVTVFVLLGVFAVTSTFEFRQRVSTRKPLADFPLTMGQWKGVRQIMEDDFIKTLKFTDYLSANYYGRDGKAVNFYVAYYADQSKGESIHSPESCLPSSGWDFRKTGLIAIPDAFGRGAFKTNRAMLEKEDLKEVAYYWFPMRGKVLNRLYEIKLHNFWDALTRRRTDGALVMVTTPVYPLESAGEADQRLRRFVAEIQPVLKEFLPD